MSSLCCDAHGNLCFMVPQFRSHKINFRPRKIFFGNTRRITFILILINHSICLIAMFSFYYYLNLNMWLHVTEFFISNFNKIYLLSLSILWPKGAPARPRPQMIKTLLPFLSNSNLIILLLRILSSYNYYY